MTLTDRLQSPSRATGVIAAAAALSLMLLGTVVLPQLAFPDAQSTVELVEGEVDGGLRLFILGGALAVLGYLPLLTAVHAVIGTRARPRALLLAGYAVLLIHPALLFVEAAVFPALVLPGLGPSVPYLLLATTGIAAALASAAIVPLAQAAATGLKRAIVAAVNGLLVALALFSFAPYIAPLSALGIGVALLMRRGTASGHDPANGPAGQH